MAVSRAVYPLSRWVVGHGPGSWWVVQVRWTIAKLPSSMLNATRSQPEQAAMTVRRCPWSSWAGPISVCASRSRPAARWSAGRDHGAGSGGSGGIGEPGCGAGGLVRLAGAEHGEDDVAAASGQADQGGVVAFAVGTFAVVEGLGRGVTQRGE